MSEKNQSRFWNRITAALIGLIVLTLLLFVSNMPTRHHTPAHLAISDIAVARAEAPEGETSSSYRFYTIAFSLKNEGNSPLDLASHMFGYEPKNSDAYVHILDDNMQQQILYNAPVLPSGASCQVVHRVRMYKADKFESLFPLELSYDPYGTSVPLATLEQDLFQ